MQIRRRSVAAVLATLTFIAPLAACSSGSDAVTDVTPSQAVEVLAEPGVTIVHLPGAVNVDVESGSFEQQIQQLPTDGTYFVYCRSGNRSGVATDQMATLGFTDVYDLQGGIVDWQSAGGQVVAG